MKIIQFVVACICGAMMAPAALAVLPGGLDEAACQSIEDAYRETSQTRLKVSLNGLWRFHPVAPEAKGVPADGWQWLKVPAVWSGNVGDRAWYRRELTVPAEAAGKRVAVAFDYLNTHADVYVDGQKAGSASFPCGEVDVTAFVKPGSRQDFAIDVTAYPQSAKTLDYNAPDRAEWRNAEVKCKGLTGDMWLSVSPEKRLAEVWAEPSVATGELVLVARVAGFDGRLTARATVEGCGEKREFSFAAEKSVDGLYRFRAPWKDAKLWDVHTPGNRYSCRLQVTDGAGAKDESTPFAFGFRDVRIEGRDILLNGIPIHLRALHNTTMNLPAEFACKESALKMCSRMKAEGFNFIIAGNYDYRAGSISYPTGLLEACDETGVLFSYSLPHFRDFDSALDKPEVAARYRELSDRAMSVVRNHPSVISYALSHNATGYCGDMNPLRIDGKYDPGDTGRLANRAQAKKARQIVRELDATRLAYHHESGNLDDFHTINIYLNWSPRQERSDWLGHWSAEGVKPLFFVEWGMPHCASWSSYRGPMFIWRNPAYQCVWGSEFSAAVRGDAAYEGDWKAARQIRVEEAMWAEKKPFMYTKEAWAFYELEGNLQGVMAYFADDVWRSHRAWGISAMLPWDQDSFFKRVKDKESVDNPNAYRDLKRPGIVPDKFVSHNGYWLDPFKWDRFRATAVQHALRRWNKDDMAFIGGDGVFTDKRHHYAEGEAVKKTLVILNDRRVRQSVGWTCELVGPDGKSVATQSGSATVEPGRRVDVPVDFANAPVGACRLKAAFTFEGNVRTEDSFALEVFPRQQGTVAVPRSIALYDPKGLTAKEFVRLGVPHQSVDRSQARTVGTSSGLVVGREALDPDLFREVLVPFAERGGRVVVYEQGAATLETCGFRVQEYGLRRAFPRAKRAGLTGLTEERLCDWSGEATLISPFLDGLAEVEVDYPETRWCGYPNTRVWRCGNRGNVSSVVPEKPTRGNWKALADGMFDLQYAPLLEWQVGRGGIVFCQFDVTARTVSDPMADRLSLALLATLGDKPVDAAAWPKTLGRDACLEADRRGLKCNHSANDGWVHFISSGAEMPGDFHQRIERGAKAVCCGMTADEIAKWSPVPLKCETRPDNAYTRIRRIPDELNGLSNADWAPRAQLGYAAFTEAAEDGNNAIRVVHYGKGTIIFWQTPPWMLDDTAKPYLRSSKRRAEWMLSHLLSWLGVFTPERSVRYADAPIPMDDPYRYYRW